MAISPTQVYKKYGLTREEQDQVYHIENIIDNILQKNWHANCGTFSFCIFYSKLSENVLSKVLSLYKDVGWNVMLDKIIYHNNDTNDCTYYFAFSANF